MKENKVLIFTKIPESMETEIKEISAETGVDVNDLLAKYIKLGMEASKIKMKND
jgi:hypothetical protein